MIYIRTLYWVENVCWVNEYFSCVNIGLGCYDFRSKGAKRPFPLSKNLLASGATPRIATRSPWSSTAR